MGAGKVIGVGLNKTGTTTLAEALRILGYRTLHFADERASSEVLLAEVARAVHAGEPPFTHVPHLHDVDAFFDVRAVHRFFPALDAAFPGSRFVLHTRPLTSWLASREQHVRRNAERQARGEYSGSWLSVDVEAWTRLYQDHHDRVRTYFADRPDDLLEIDVTRGDGWEKLAPFLGRPVPDEPFPWANRARRTGLRARVQRIGQRAQQGVARRTASRSVPGR